MKRQKTPLEVKNYYEKLVKRELEECLEAIKQEGFNENTYTTLRLFKLNLEKLESIDFFYGLWFPLEEGCKNGMIEEAL